MELEAYSPATDTWEQLPPMPTPRHGLAAAAAGGAIYLIGGGTVEGFGPSAVAEAFRPR